MAMLAEVIMMICGLEKRTILVLGLWLDTTNIMDPQFICSLSNKLSTIVHLIARWSGWLLWQRKSIAERDRYCLCPLYAWTLIRFSLYFSMNRGCAFVSWLRMMWRFQCASLRWDQASSVEPTFAWLECCLIVPQSEFEYNGYVLIIFRMSDSFSDCNQSVWTAFISVLEVSFRDDGVFTTVWLR